MNNGLRSLKILAEIVLSSVLEGHFELSSNKAKDLFYKSHYKQETSTVQDVIMNIQEVIKKKEDEERFKQTSGTS